MSRKSVDERIDRVKKRIEELQSQKKLLVQEQDRKTEKARTHRLCRRAGLLEKMLPDTILLTDEQFETLLKRTIANDFGRSKLSELAPPPPTEPQNETPTPNGEKPTPKATETAGHTNAPPPSKSAKTEQGGGTGGNADGGGAMSNG